MKKYRTHLSKDLSLSLVGQEVILSGWIHNKRDHGGIIFIDLRDYGKLDHDGLVQCRCENSDLGDVNLESVIKIHGKVLKRPSESINPDMINGDIEIDILSYEVLSHSNHIPFPINNDVNVNYSLRSHYRFLDLRRPSTRKMIQTRNAFMMEVRNLMHQDGFSEFQTPLLTGSSPEGARDYLVPSRLHKGKFYALPQAPQICKQLIIASGFENYYQIAPCFRDEDGRADRTPGEFYQLDVEISFGTQNEVLLRMKPILIALFEKFGTLEVDNIVTTLSYKNSLKMYGTDKPNLQIPLYMEDISNIKIDFFNNNGMQYISCIKFANGASNSRKWLNDYDAFAKSIGMHGLGYIKYTDNKISGPIAKFLSDDNQKEIINQVEISNGDLVFFIADSSLSNMRSLGAKIISHAKVMSPEIIDNRYKICFIVDFPFFEKIDNKIDFAHNPFSMPKGGIDDLKNIEPTDILACQYDVVCNGYEIASGAERNYSLDIMKEAFRIVGYSIESLQKDFYPLYIAMQYGLPPHAGIAFGLERILMLCLDTDNIKDVLLFPMEQSAESKLFNCPSVISEYHLKELGLSIMNDIEN